MLAGFAFLVYLAWSGWPELRTLLQRLNLRWSILALLALLAANGGAAAVFAGLSRRDLGVVASPGELAGSFLMSQTAKYVPGRIWSVVLQAIVLRSRLSVAHLMLANTELALITLLLTLGTAVAFLRPHTLESRRAV